MTQPWLTHLQVVRLGEISCLFFRATPATYGDSQARGLSGAVATGLHYSQSNTRSLTARPGNQGTHLGCISFFFFLFFFFFVFLGPHPKHMEAPKLGVESAL